MNPKKSKIKPVKKVTIKNPKLRAIRDNLRIIIKLAVIDEYERLKDLQSLYLDKRMKGYTLTPSQEKRDIQLHHQSEYLIDTFSNSVCICASRRRIHDADIKGDRVRLSIIWEYPETIIAHLRYRYLIEEKWYSLQYYQENQKFFDDGFKKMKERMVQRPDSITTPQEIYQLDLILLRKYGTVAPIDWINTAQ